MNVTAQKRWFESVGEPKLELLRVRDFEQSLTALRVFGLRPGLSTGWRTLDEYYTVRPREWTLVTGIPSHGKSTFLDALMVNLAMSEERWHFAVFSPENWPLERHAATLAGQYIGKNLNRCSDVEFAKAKTWLDLVFTFVVPDEADYTIDRLLELMTSAIRRDPLIRGIVIDPWNELDHSRPANVSETEYVSRFLTKIRRFARAHEVHLFLVAHPTKLPRLKNADGSQDSVYPVPTPYDVSGSAHFRNKADCCICVYRDVTSGTNETDVYVQKIRFREVGRVGVNRLRFDPDSGRFMDLKSMPRVDELVERQRNREPGDDDE